MKQVTSLSCVKELWNDRAATVLKYFISRGIGLLLSWNKTYLTIKREIFGLICFSHIRKYASLLISWIQIWHTYIILMPQTTYYNINNAMQQTQFNFYHENVTISPHGMSFVSKCATCYERERSVHVPEIWRYIVWHSFHFQFPRSSLPLQIL